MNFKVATLSLLLASICLAECAINIKGDDICTGQKALYSEQIDSDNNNLEIVKVDFVDSLNRAFIITEKGKVMVEVDNLVGVEKCDEDFCLERKIRVDLNCTKVIKKQKVSLQDVFSNGQASVKESLFSKPRLIEQNCIR